MSVADLSKQEFSKFSGLKTEIDQQQVDFAYKNLQNLPFKGKKSANYERMISGMPYNCFDHALETTRMGIRDILLDYGKFRMKDYPDVNDYNKARADYIRSFIGHCGKNVFMEYPINFDYGFNTYLGENFYANYDLKILDVALVKIGDNVMCATGVSILTATHPTDPTLRCNGVECGLPVTIEDYVWLGANSVILPGVTVGKCSVVAAGAVVNRDVPPYTVVAGVPAKVVKTLNPIEENFDAQAVLRKHGLDFTN
jgi:acetyltransferase-like isoleucine patch superfamily enzyme